MSLTLKTAGVLLITVIAAASCVSVPRDYREMDKAVENQNYALAVEVIEKGQSKKQPFFSERNAVLLYLNKGFLEHYAGNYEESSKSLQRAERLIEDAYTKSISEGFFSYIINDNVKEYPGEDFEDIYLNVFNALNYYNRGDTEGALVEIRKLSMTNGKLDLLAGKYEYTDPNTGASLNEMAERETGVSQMPQTVSVNFSNSALARFLGALFYQADKKFDSARIEFDQVYRAFNANKDIYYFDVPAAVGQARNIPSQKARLNIIAFTGLSPVKKERQVNFYLPLYNPFLGVSSVRLPVLVRRPSQITAIEVIINGRDRFYLELLEDISSVIEETYKARFSSIYLKTFIRSMVKYTAADISAVVVAREHDLMAGLLTAITARTVVDLSERADTRMSRYLPGKAHIGGINLDPGTYSVIINYYRGNSVIAKDYFDDVKVGLDGLNLLQSVKLR